MIYLIRHDQVSPKFQNKFLGRLDVNIINYRHYYSKSAIVENAVVITSPLKRCIQTIKLLGYEEFKIDQRAVEFDVGRYAGLTITSRVSRMIGMLQYIPDSNNHRGETFHAFSERVIQFYDELKQLSSIMNRPIVVVTHSGVIRYLVSKYLSILPEIYMPNHLEMIEIDPATKKYNLFQILKNHETNINVNSIIQENHLQNYNEITPINS